MATVTVQTHCVGPQPLSLTGLRCRFPGGLEVPAAVDLESHCLACQPPKELASLRFEVYDELGAVVCASCDPTARLLPESATDRQAPDITAHTVGPPGAPDAGHGSSVAGVIACLSWLDRLLPLWILAAMVLGVLLGVFVPAISSAFSVIEIQGVSLPIAIGLWAMMWPVLTKVRYEVLPARLRKRAIWMQLGGSLFVNWVVGPALMTGLAWAALPDLPSYRTGVILVGLARCIAMVLLWNQLACGDPELCAFLVAVNSVLQMVLYAPLALFYIQVVSGGGGSVRIGFWEVARSVLLFLGVPLAAAVVTRYSLLRAKGEPWFTQSFMPWFSPVALLGLLYTIVVMFALQGHQVIVNIGSVVRVAIPMVLYFAVMFTATLAASWRMGVRYEQAATQAFTASSNNFELAIAIAVATFGIKSNEALAATVGPMIEVPVLLGLVYVALALRKQFTG